MTAHEWIEVLNRRWCVTCGSYQVRRRGFWRDEMVGPYPMYSKTDASQHTGDVNG